MKSMLPNSDPMKFKGRNFKSNISKKTQTKMEEELYGKEAIDP